MADPKQEKEKSVEMRLAELEDRLAQVHISDEEMKIYAKVSSLLGASGGNTQYTPAPDTCSVCVIPRFRYINRGILPRINRWVCECNECQCGPCSWGGGFGGGGGGGFGGFGS